MSLAPLPWDCIFYMMEWLEPDDLMNFPPDYIHAYCNDVTTPLRQFEISLYCDYIVPTVDYAKFTPPPKGTKKPPWIASIVIPPEQLLWMAASVAATEKRMDVLWVILTYITFIISLKNKGIVWITLKYSRDVYDMVWDFLSNKRIGNYKIFTGSSSHVPRIMIRLEAYRD